MPEKSQPWSRSLLLTIILGLGGALLIASALLLTPKPQPAAPTAIPGTPFAPRISLADAKKAFDDGAAIFVDVRSIEAYQAGHIKGALSIPEGELANNFSSLDKNTWIITYCT